jgi:hypothetical protein
LTPGGQIKLNFYFNKRMDKRRKTRWEKRMLRWQIILIVTVPLLFGLVFWLVAHHNPVGK